MNEIQSATPPILLLKDETGELWRHYENCSECGGYISVRVTTAKFPAWSQIEKCCVICAFQSKEIIGIPVKPNTVSRRNNEDD